MSDIERKDEETEVEGHKQRNASDEPAQGEDEDSEVEAHKHRPKHRPNFRLD